MKLATRLQISLRHDLNQPSRLQKAETCAIQPDSADTCQDILYVCPHFQQESAGNVRSQEEDSVLCAKRRQASANIYAGTESATPQKAAASMGPRSSPSFRADIYGGTESVTPATQIEPDVLKVSRLSRKRPRRPWAPVRRQASADIYGGTESVTPATQIEAEAAAFVAKLPWTSIWRCRECHACHANRG